MKKTLTLFAAIATLAGFSFAQSAGDLLITEWIADPLNTGDANGEYFELYNTTGSDIDVNGWEILDDGIDSHTISGSVVVPAYGFAVFAIDGNSATNGGISPVAYVYTGITLANGGDEIVIEKPDNTVITRVTYTDGDSHGDGIAWELDDYGTHPTGVLVQGDFVAATAALTSGDFGSPNAAGNTLPVEISAFGLE